ncbi:ribonuclease [Nitratireductor mangrovi]|uniref:Ribonuclease n=1 Tax=Nitratireductor mangrovi TaxID=2599600 RepID=A0A5B8KUU5_9HYPH|nr:ribonuclease [Nitratireductor mangrovi]QDY99350.1 ribonuclease [Nitratireductor mangrovi]
MSLARAAFLLALCISLTGLAVTSGRAEVRLEGRFLAQSSCPATPAIRNKANPGKVRVRPGEAYALLAGNKPEPTHLLITVPGARPERRWVSVDCGQWRQAEAGSSAQKPRTKQAPARRKTELVLAVNWQPGFCETRPKVRECRSQSAGRYDASHFSLHGLWPQPPGTVYCGVPERLVETDRSGSWRSLPELGLEADLLRELFTVMPGAASYLHRHEWFKHGSCYGTDAQAYYADSLALMRALNASAARDFFAARIGRKVTAAQIRRAFDEAFGEGAGGRVRVACVIDPSNGRRLIGEITIALGGPIGEGASLADLIHAARPTGNTGCPEGIVDPAGLQ